MSDPQVNFGTDVEDLDTSTLREEYEELNERRFSHTITENGRNRRVNIWQELRHRSDVLQPECPECGARNWTFTDHTECSDCGYGLSMGDEALLQEVQSAWDQIAGRRNQEADA